MFLDRLQVIELAQGHNTDRLQVIELVQDHNTDRPQVIELVQDLNTEPTHAEWKSKLLQKSQFCRTGYAKFLSIFLVAQYHLPRTLLCKQEFIVHYY